MTRFTRIFGRRPLTLPAVLYVALCFGCGKAATETYKVGHLVPLSGPQREAGEAAANGVQLAVDELNADSDLWVNGRKIDVVHADTQGKLEIYAAQTVRLTVVNRVTALIGGTSAAETDDIAGVAQGRDEAAAAAPSKGIILITGSGFSCVPKTLTVFAFGLPAADRAKALIRFAKESLRASRVAIATEGRSPDQSGFVVAAEAAAAEFKLSADTVPLSDDGAVKRLTALAKAQPSVAVIYVGDSGGALALRDQLRALGAGDAAFLYAGDDGLIMLGPSDRARADGMYAVTNWILDGKQDRAREFAKRFRDKFSRDPEAAAALGYDSAKLLFSTAKTAQGFTSTKLHAALKDITFPALPGDVTFDKDQVAQGLPAVVVQWHAAGPEVKVRYESSPKTK